MLYTSVCCASNLSSAISRSCSSTNSLIYHVLHFGDTERNALRLPFVLLAHTRGDLEPSLLWESTWKASSVCSSRPEGVSLMFLPKLANNCS